MYRIRGIVRFCNYVRQSAAQPMTDEMKNYLLAKVRENVERIEALCRDSGMTPSQLPARSRVAYYYLKNFNGDKIRVGAPPPEPVKRFSEEDRETSELFQNVYAEMFNKTRPQMVVDYYPYSSLKSAVRNYGNVIHVRISDVLRDAPVDVKKAQAALLLCKLERTKCPPNVARVFRDYINSPEMQSAYDNLRQTRGEKLILGPAGKFYDLEDSFRRVNEHYFSGQLPKPNLTWSERKAHRRLGHEDCAMNTVVISKALDDRRVPVFVLDYVMYHELLHIKHRAAYRGGRRNIHTSAFKEDERKFIRWRDAEDWLKHNRV